MYNSEYILGTMLSGFEWLSVTSPSVSSNQSDFFLDYFFQLEKCCWASAVKFAFKIASHEKNHKYTDGH